MDINSTAIGDYYTPQTRLPGSGGAHDVAAGGQKFIIMVRHEKSRLVDKLAYRTSPGFIQGGNSRKDLGLPGGGPCAIVTDLATLTPEPDTKEFVLSRLHPFSTVEEVRDNTGWKLRTSERLEESLRPTVTELEVLRNELDVEGEFTGWKNPVPETRFLPQAR